MTCDHEETGSTSHATYCLKCGQQVQPPAAPDYFQALEDSRRLRWTHVSKMKPALGVVYIGALFDERTRVWRIGRVQWCDDCQHWEVAQGWQNIHQHDHTGARVTHIAPDLLGTPYDPSERAVGRPTLRSV